MTGNASLLAQAVDQTDAVISAIPAGKARAPTPCTDFDVTQLIAHVAVIADRVSAAIAPASAQPSTDWEHARAQLRPVLDGAGTGRVVDLPFGRMPLDAALGVYAGEFVTHSWDLAAAAGRADLLSDELGTQALAMVTARIPPSPRTHTPLQGRRARPRRRPVYDRLAGWMGRDPAWWHPASRRPSRSWAPAAGSAVTSPPKPSPGPHRARRHPPGQTPARAPQPPDPLRRRAPPRNDPRRAQRCRPRDLLPRQLSRMPAGHPDRRRPEPCQRDARTRTDTPGLGWLAKCPGGEGVQDGAELIAGPQLACECRRYHGTTAQVFMRSCPGTPPRSRRWAWRGTWDRTGGSAGPCTARSRRAGRRRGGRRGAAGRGSPRP